MLVRTSTIACSIGVLNLIILVGVNASEAAYPEECKAKFCYNPFSDLENTKCWENSF